MDQAAVANSGRLYDVARLLGIISVVIIPVNSLLFFGAVTGLSMRDGWVFVLCVLLAVAQVILGWIAAILALIHYSRTPGLPNRGWVAVLAVVSSLAGLGGLAALGMGALVVAAFAGGGGAWGRPLRVRGRILHPDLCAGSDWTRGARPDVSALDRPTRAALEALWLHDAQKEHASVPAFSRISWMLAAVGAPAELLEGAHNAALEEIDHTRRCFALAAGYAGRSHSVEAMPDLLVGGLDVPGDPLVYLAEESLKDGCLLEDFNADVAAECVKVCRDPATKDVLSRIAREERSHAEFSWAMLAWLSARGGEKVRRAIAAASEGLARVPRPTAATPEKQALIDKADPDALRAHGRLPDAQWAALWTMRLDATRARVEALLSEQPERAAA